MTQFRTKKSEVRMSVSSWKEAMELQRLLSLKYYDVIKLTIFKAP